MKVVQLAKYYPPAVGGIENNVRQLAQIAAASGHESVVIASNHDYTRRRTVTDADGPVRVVRLPTVGHLWSLPLSLGWLRALRREREGAVIHLHAPNPLAEVACLIGAEGRALVVSDHGLVRGDRPGSGARRALYRALLRRSRAVVTYTQAFASSHPNEADFHARLRVIPHATDPDAFVRSPAVEERAKAIAGGADGPVVLFVGRLVGYKGVDVLLDAFDEVAAPSTLLIVGDGPERRRLEAKASGMKRRDRVRFVGELPHGEVVPYYAAAAVVVLPSLTPQESFGQALVEAALVGTPAVATKVESGVQEVVEDTETGLLVAPGDAHALSAAIELLLTDATLRRRLGEAARARAVLRFALPAVSIEVAKLYAEVQAP